MAISPESRKLWEEVKANLARLDACPRHRFNVTLLTAAALFGRPFKCEMCAGTMGMSEIGDYIRGYKAAGGSVDDIWPGWEERNGMLYFLDPIYGEG